MCRKPKLLVFDLDYTLWPFWVDTHVKKPFSRDNQGNIVDANGAIVKSYPEVSEVLKQLKEDGYLLGIASRTSEYEGATQSIDLFGWTDYFNFKEIYTGFKVKHFNNIQKASNIDFKDMIFFDDEYRNITDLRKHGVYSIMIDHGVNKDVVEKAIKNYSKL